MWKTPYGRHYAPWGYEVLHTGGRGQLCAHEIKGQENAFQAYPYKVAVEGNDVLKTPWVRLKEDYKDLKSICADIGCHRCNRKYQYGLMAKSAFAKAADYVSSHKLSGLPYYVVLEINNGKLDAGGRFVSFDPDLLNATMYSFS